MMRLQHDRIGFRVERFDTRLLEQVIEVDIDLRLRKMAFVISDNERDACRERILQAVLADIRKKGTMQALLPCEVVLNIRRETQRILAALCHDRRNRCRRLQEHASQGCPMLSGIRGMRLVFAPVTMLCRAIFEKRIE